MLLSIEARNAGLFKWWWGGVAPHRGGHYYDLRQAGQVGVKTKPEPQTAMLPGF